VAPEFIVDNEAVVPTTASDIYALGCLGLKVCMFSPLLKSENLKEPIVYLFEGSICGKT
jgi:hypothetical protein